MTTTTETREHPILFSGEMVRAILEDRKTQTRRVIDLSPSKVLSLGQRKLGWTFNTDLARVGDVCKMVASLRGETTDYDAQQISVPARHPDDSHIPWEECGYERVYCPHGGPGDRLWVREACAIVEDRNAEAQDSMFWATVKYKADGATVREMVCLEDWKESFAHPGSGWRPSIHMPRWASRITLELTAVRVERLHAIEDNSDDVRAEGIQCPVSHHGNCVGYCRGLRERFEETWRAIYGKDSWESDPWVWVIEFKRLDS